MKTYERTIAVQVVSNERCVIQDYVSVAEEESLSRLRELRDAAARIKRHMAEAQSSAGGEYAGMAWAFELGRLRQKARHWQRVRRLATQAKLAALGHGENAAI